MRTIRFNCLTIAVDTLSLLIVSSLLLFFHHSIVLAEPTIRYVTTDGNCAGASPCYSSIQAAINAAIDGDEIRVAQGTYTQKSTGDGITGGVLIINKIVSLVGGYTSSDWNNSEPDARPTVIDPQNNGVGIYINYQEDIGIHLITIDGFSITGGNASEAIAGTDSGGGIFIDHTTHTKVIIQNCDIYDNIAEDGSGGGIWATRTDNINILNTNIHDNSGSGMIITYSDNPVILDSVVYNNSGKGIGIISSYGQSTQISRNQITYNQGSGVDLNTVLGGMLTDNIITDNSTDGGGGGLDISGVVNDFLIGSNTILRNVSMQGSGINISGSIAQITNNTIEYNTTTSSSNGGGGLYVNAGSTGSYVLISGNQINYNTTTNQGGGMVILGFVDVLNNTIKENHGSSGGAIVAASSGKISDNLIQGNMAQIGGGIRTVNVTGLSIERNYIVDNHATNGDGGGMSLWGGLFMDLSLDSNQVISNTATTKGGGIYIECPTGVDPIQIANTVLADNYATNGSGLYSTVCDVDLAYTTVASNQGNTGDGIGLYLRDPTGTGEYQIENTIVVDQTVGIYIQSGSANLEATFWGVDNWANDANTGGSGTIDTGTFVYQGDPRFADPENDDYHILENSPVIDKGIDTWISTDMDGQYRVMGESDIGADEYGQSLFTYLPLMLK